MKTSGLQVTSSGPDRKESEQTKLSNALWRYGFAVTLVLSAFGIRYSLSPILGEELPFMLFIAAALLAAWYGGAKTGILALFLGLCLADYFFLWSKRVLTMSHSVIFFHVVRYVFTASLGIILIEVLHRSRQRLQKAQELLRLHAAELEMRVAERTSSLASSLRSLEEILYHIAHHLRAPLRAMGGYSMVLVSDYGEQLEDAGKQHLRRISKAAAQMDTLIADLLDYGRITHAQVSPTQVRVGEILERALRCLEYQVQTRNAEVNIFNPFQPVLADPKVLEQVLVNLLENAIKFVAKNTAPRVEVRGETRGEMVRLSIKDNGIGMDMQYRDRIFGAFERLHSGEAYEGTGIGLAIVKQGVERMGGRVGVESRPGAGSTFWVELPGVKHEKMDKDLEKTEETQTTVARLLCEHNSRQPV